MALNIRERTEELEYAYLAPQAAKSRAARRKEKGEECALRTSFQRDRDRILHSKSFRRLKHKTQVYIVAGDHYRTRMTHSLEVAQISRTIARGLRLNEDIAIGHDVGHTPFGHAGESVMAELAGHFAHNEQSLRVVEFLEKGGKGLNLTYEVKDGIVNHTGPHLPKTLEGRIVRRPAEGRRPARSRLRALWPGHLFDDHEHGFRHDRELGRPHGHPPVG